MSKVGQKLQRLRQLKGISQKEIANKANLSSAQFISNIERGVSTISPMVLKRTCKFLGADLGRMIKLMELDYGDKVRKRAGL